MLNKLHGSTVQFDLVLRDIKVKHGLQVFCLVLLQKPNRWELSYLSFYLFLDSVLCHSIKG